MTFPVETEASIRRRILDICREQTRNVVDITRELALMTDSVGEGKGKDAKDHYQNMIKILDNFEGTKKKLLEEVASFGALLSNREDFIRLIFRIGEVADYAQGIGFRLTAVVDRSWKVDKKYTKRLSELIALVLEEMSKIRETMMSLGFNPTKAMDLSRGVEETEKKVDAAYRSLDLEVLDEKIPLRTLLLIRDLSAHMDNMADLGVDVVDGRTKEPLGKGVLLSAARETYRGFSAANQVYKDLREKGYVVTPGIKFGADFAVYEHGPGIDHAPFIVSVETPDSIMSPFEVVRAGRLATTVRKHFILAIPDTKSGKIRYLVFQWFKA